MSARNKERVLILIHKYQPVYECKEQGKSFNPDTEIPARVSVQGKSFNPDTEIPARVSVQGKSFNPDTEIKA